MDSNPATAKWARLVTHLTYHVSQNVFRGIRVAAYNLWTVRIIQQAVYYAFQYTLNLGKLFSKKFPYASIIDTIASYSRIPMAFTAARISRARWASRTIQRILFYKVKASDPEHHDLHCHWRQLWTAVTSPLPFELQGLPLSHVYQYECLEHHAVPALTDSESE